MSCCGADLLVNLLFSFPVTEVENVGIEEQAYITKNVQEEIEKSAMLHGPLLGLKNYINVEAYPKSITLTIEEVKLM